MRDSRLLWIAALVAVVLGALGYWIGQHVERVDTPQDLGPTEVALRQPYFAAQRVLENLGQRVMRVQTVADAYPDAHDTVLQPVLDMGESPAILNNQLAAVANGATWIINVDDVISAQGWASNTAYVHMLRGLGVMPARSTSYAARAAIELPGTAYGLQISAPPAPVLHAPRMIAADNGRNQIIVIAHGAGRVVLLTSDTLLKTRVIGQKDNAEVLWQLTRLNGAQRVWLVTEGQSIPWYQRLWHSAAPMLLVLLALLLLSLWRVSWRFGPLLPPAQPVRRSLIEHLEACGRWYWQQRKQHVLLEACRAQLRRSLQRHLPHLAAMPAPQLAPRLAQISGRDEHAIGVALTANGDHAPQHFTDQIALLQALTLAIETRHRIAR